MIPIIVSGACGRMGTLILSCGVESDNISIAGALESADHPDLRKSVSEACGIPGCDVIIEPDLEAFEGREGVLVEFTNPEATLEHLKTAIAQGRPTVVGTTGLTREQEKEIEHAASDIPIVYAANTSKGVNVLLNLVERCAGILDDEYDIEIFELHHRFKKDAPSGTAIRLGEATAKARKLDPEQAFLHGRKGIVGERKKVEIGIHAMRAGDVVGEHTVIFSTLGERIELTHRCHNRRTFAEGALDAARFCSEQQPGLYSMRHVLRIT